MPRFSKKTMPELEADHASSASPLSGLLHLVVHNVRSLHNVGSIFRTADCFGVKELILTGYTPTPPDPRLSKTALGAEKSVSWRGCDDAVNCLREFKEQGVLIAALEQTRNSTPLERFDPKGKPICLILGNEVTGVDEDLLSWADVTLEITQFGSKHSLNVSVAAGVALHTLSNRMNEQSQHEE